MSINRSLSVELGRGTRRFQRFVTLGGAKPAGEPPRPRGVFDPELLRAAIPHAFRKLDPRPAHQEPGHVRRRDHRGPRDDHGARQRDRHPGERPGWASRSRSRSGCGSPSCSRPMPRPSPRPAAAPRRRRSGGPARSPSPTAGWPTARSRTSARPSFARATSSSSRKARRSRATATSSRASPTSTRPRSPANRRRSSRSPGPTSAAP